MGSIAYADAYRDIDFRKYPQKYPIGKGEQGVLIAEPYKSEILPYWKFATPEMAALSAKKIYALFERYGKQQDFVGMDMARKFLQMGFTRSRRYANHSSGKKYDTAGNIRPQEADWDSSDKAESARMFYEYYERAKANSLYAKLKAEHLRSQKQSAVN